MQLVMYQHKAWVRVWIKRSATHARAIKTCPEAVVAGPRSKPPTAYNSGGMIQPPMIKSGRLPIFSVVTNEIPTNATKTVLSLSAQTDNQRGIRTDLTATVPKKGWAKPASWKKYDV